MGRSQNQFWVPKTCFYPMGILMGTFDSDRWFLGRRGCVIPASTAQPAAMQACGTCDREHNRDQDIVLSRNTRFANLL